VLLIIADVIFFSVVFVFLDSNEAAVLNNPARAEDWIQCLVSSHGNKNKCVGLAKPLIVNEATVMAVLILLSCNGVWLLLLMGRFTMFTGWYELVKGVVKPNREFVSADARALAFTKDARSYEVLASGGKENTSKTPDLPLTPISPAARSGRGTPDYFGREAKYKNPTQSFSSPRAPRGRSWDPNATNAQSSHRIDPLSMNKI